MLPIYERRSHTQQHSLKPNNIIVQLFFFEGSWGLRRTGFWSVRTVPHTWTTPTFGPTNLNAIDLIELLPVFSEVKPASRTEEAMPQLPVVMLWLNGCGPNWILLHRSPSRCVARVKPIASEDQYSRQTTRFCPSSRQGLQARGRPMSICPGRCIQSS